MTRLMTLVALTMMLTMACGGGSDNDNPGADVAADVAGDVKAGETTTDDAVEGTDSAVPEDMAVDAAAADLAPTEALVKHVCDVYCDFALVCLGEEPAETCEADCASMAADDVAYANQLVCASAAHDDDGEAQEYCDFFDACATAIELPEDCETMCPKMEACGAVNNDSFGYSISDCHIICGAFVTHDPDAADAMDCLAAALDSCSGIEFFACVEDDLPTCDETLCEEAFATECGHVPAVFETAAACTASCIDWGAGQQLASGACMDMTADWPLECADRAEACLEVPAELPDGAMEYCDVINDKCNYMGMELGDLTDEICAWQLTGITSALPELFVPFTDAATCLAELEQCPPGDGGFMVCLIQAPEAAEAACATILDVCEPADFAGEMELTCRMMTAFGEAVFPEMVATIVDCLNAAVDCDGKMACFPEDEE